LDAARAAAEQQRIVDEATTRAIAELEVDPTLRLH
jgi:hypothetical protein